METPRRYTELTPQAFAQRLDDLFTDPSILDTALHPDGAITYRTYIEKNLPYTVYLLSLIFDEGPKLGYLIRSIARHLFTDRVLKNEYEQLLGYKLEETGVNEFPKSIITVLVNLDRGTWLSPARPGCLIDFNNAESGSNNFGSSLPALAPVNEIPGSRHALGFDLVKISTELSPYIGVTYQRTLLESSSHNYKAGGKAYRRLVALQELAKIYANTGESVAGLSVHTSLPIYAYSANQGDNLYLLAYPAMFPQHTDFSGQQVCLLADFLVARPQWWLSLSKEEKRGNILKWISCLASSVAFFHSLKVTHSGISASRIFLVKNNDNINIYLQDWHVKPTNDRSMDHSKSRKGASRPQTSSYIKAEPDVGHDASASKSASSSALGTGVKDDSPAALARAHDVGLLGDIMGELVLVLVGLTKDVLLRQRRERAEWSRRLRNNQTLGSFDNDFYPKAPSTISDTSSSSATSEITEVKMPATPEGEPQIVEHSSKSRQSSPSKDKSKERPQSGLFGMFSKKDGASSSQTVLPTIIEPESFKPKRSGYGISHKISSMSSSSSSSSTTGWWLEELRLMYPTYATEDVKLPQPNWSKHTNFLGNHMLPLLAAMVQPNQLSRPRAESVWKETCKINDLFFGKTTSCCSYADESCRKTRASIRDVTLGEIYQRGIADEDEESWRGLGWNNADKKNGDIGRRGEGAVGESLFD